MVQHADGHTHLSYRVDVTVDLEGGVITNAGAELSNLSDQTDFLGRVDEAQETLAERALPLAIVVADKGHHSGENLAGLKERGLISLVSSPRTERNPPGFQRLDFTYDATTDTFRCPAGKSLRRRKSGAGEGRHYQARASDCQKCPHFGLCTKGKQGRSVRVAEHEELIQANRERVHSAEARPLLMIRRQRGEAPFGYCKQFGGLRRFAGRGLSYAQKKTLVAAAGWNLLCLLRHARRPGAEPTGAPGAEGSAEGGSGALFGLLWRLWRALGAPGSRWGPILRFASPRGAIAEAGRSAPLSVPLLRAKAHLSGGC